MNRRLIIFSLLFCCFFYCKGQNSAIEFKIDSLRKEIAVAKHDTLKSLNYLLIADQLRSTDVNQSIANLDTAYTISKKLNYDRGIAEYYYMYAKTLGMVAQYENAIEHFDSSIKYYSKINYQVSIANAYLYKGMCLSYLGRNIEAFETYNKGIILINKDSNYSVYISLMEAIANVYNSMGYFGRAIEIYYSIIELAEKNEDTRMEKLSIANVGQTLAAMDKYSEGLGKLLHALKYFEETEEKYQISGILSNIGYIYGNLGHYEKAVYYYSQALEVSLGMNNYHVQLVFSKSISELQIKLGNTSEARNILFDLINKFEEIRDNDKVAETYTILGSLFSDEKLYGEALTYYQKSFEKIEKTERKDLRLKVSLDLAKSYFQNNLLVESEKLLNYIIPELQDLKMLSTLADVYNYKFLINEKRGDFKNALEYYKKYQLIIDSLDIQKQLVEVEKIRFEYETEAIKNEFLQSQTQANLEKTSLEKKLLIRTYVIISIIFIFLIVIAALYLIIQRNRASSKAIEAEINLKVLRSQMNPHFIFNALTSIHGFVMSSKTEMAGEYLLKFSNLMRMILEQCRNPYVDLKSEIELLELYLALESARLNFNFDYQINFDKINNPENILIPPMMIQPIVENAVWHGIGNLKERRGFINLSFEIENDILVCKVSDNGVGRYASQTMQQNNYIKKENSYGINIIEERINLLNGKYNLTGSIKFNDREQGLDVVIKLPIDFEV